MMLAWGARVSPEFRTRVVALCGRLGIADPSWLMACMAFETGRTFSASVRNPTSGATGLIQFMPGTATDMGTSVAALALKTPEAQLEDVEAYFRPYAGRLHSLDDVYMAILWPKAIGRLFNAPLFSAADLASKAYLQNKGLDINADGVVTKGEATAYVQRALDEGMQPGNVAEINAGEAISPPAVSAHPDVAPDAPAPDSQPPEKPMFAALLPMILQMFAPRAQATLSQITGQPADVLAPFLQNLFAQIGQVTQVGPIKTDAQAVAAVAELQKLKDANSALVGQVEAHALDYLDKVAPILDKLNTYDQGAWAAEETSRNNAADRAIAQQKEGPLYSNPTFLIAVFVLALVAIVVIAVLFKGGFSTDMQAFVIGAVVGSALTAVLSFYFGSSRNSAAKDATISQLANKPKG